jgi:hypothetical protein
VAALVLSVTRTALAGAALGCVAMLALGRRGGAPVRAAAGAAAAMLVVMVVATMFGGPGDARLGQRLRWWRDGEWFRARYTLPAGTARLATGGTAELPVTVENTGTLAWPHAGQDAVALSYHWERSDAHGSHLDFEGRRTPLPRDVAPGDRLALAGRVKAPDEPGRYRLRWDLVRENVTWFSNGGTPTGDETVDVAGQRPAAAHGKPLVAASLEDFMSPPLPGRPELWRAAVRLWRRRPLLGVGPDNFRRLYPEVVHPAHGRYSDERLHANNLYLETLADLGLAGLGALALLMIALARTARARVAGGAGPLAIACLVAVGTFFVHGLLDYFLEFTPTYVLFWLTVALASGGWPAAPTDPSPAPTSSTPSASPP